MSYTNQTQHYGLPQYIGSDVPAYLTDYNEAMAKIDQGMNAAKTQADSAATAAGQAANDITSLNSTVGTQAAQISAAAQAASAAQTTANTADNKADALDGRVTTLEQGGLTEHRQNAQVQVTNQWGNMYISSWVPYDLPSGKTVDDIVGISCVSGLLFFASASGVAFASPIQTATSVNVEITYLLK